ncbi:MAG: class I SAM-dependent methyltransferase [Cytophagales bacterium]
MINQLICLKCSSSIIADTENNHTLKCINCNSKYHVVNGIPVIIGDQLSVFSTDDFISNKNLFFDISKKGKFFSKISKLLPQLGGNNLGTKNFDFLETLITKDSNVKPNVLIIGGSIVGDGMKNFIVSSKINILESDVSFGARTKIIFDVHQIPFQDQTFDAVIVQAVLEHVIDPIKSVKEIHRVLKSEGIVYSETPFMQQVHGGAFDFQRYTRSGHRYLFKEFEEIKSGATAGSGTALAWSLQFFLLSMFGFNNRINLAIKLISRLLFFWLKYLDVFDNFLKTKYDGSSGFYFIGKKSNSSMSYKDIISYHR